MSGSRDKRKSGGKPRKDKTREDTNRVLGKANEINSDLFRMASQASVNNLQTEAGLQSRNQPQIAGLKPSFSPSYSRAVVKFNVNMAMLGRIIAELDALRPVLSTVSRFILEILEPISELLDDPLGAQLEKFKAGQSVAQLNTSMPAYTQGPLAGVEKKRANLCEEMTKYLEDLKNFGEQSTIFSQSFRDAHKEPVDDLIKFLKSGGQVK
ncbi:hypothetical protein BS50DRAFT_570879 [Corynespora cassiicola Philippines]|uniref:Uncharacterized protein n=1 Tax=Corynespora cassiicola Philippines TaxID=1448308 RepID=A0A2T2P1K9_CORCC|nr:hypothetical protein BS50DRAFT_570879 [Corynespora cassiicola Philippines]